MPRSSTDARRYAEAAFQVALQDGSVKVWADALGRAASAYADPRVGAVLRNPTVARQARQLVLERVLVQPLTQPVLNLVGLLMQRRRIELLPLVAAEFQRLVDRRDGVTTATVTSASELSGDERRDISDRLVQLTGGPVRLATAVDPALIGGLVVRVGDRQFDGSVRGRLERLRNRLVSSAL
ncbi:MAG TPA: F0F1 ATP synthase subunit delta [Candidatus Acidoferrales bacterium]|nr:F0F1 ATP synthase subunit delta [Candidatus Acidoferrales bacterium]